ncbi:hypothetical protein LINGRAHAP2_LOCUS20260, partial [Linum grandiflorum]
LQNKQHNRDLIDLLVKSFDPLSKTFHIGGSVFRVTAADVERVYGLPSSGQEVDIETCGEKYVLTFSKEVKLDRNQGMFISFRQLKDKLRSTKDSSAFAKLYILLCIGELLAPGNSDKVSLMYAAYLHGNFASMKMYNWSQHVVDTALVGLAEHKTTGRVYPSGDINFLIMHLLDSMVVEKFHANVKPTCGYWDDGKIRRVVQNLRRPDGTLTVTLKDPNMVG